MEKYKLNNQAIVAAVERVIKENNLLIQIEYKTHLVLKQDGFFLFNAGHCTMTVLFLKKPRNKNDFEVCNYF
jgi:hypothetical protein